MPGSFPVVRTRAGVYGCGMARRPSRHAGALIVTTIGLLAVGLIGWAIGRETTATRTVTVGAATTAPAGHRGVGVPAHEFGDPVAGAKLFVSKGCANCHSYGGKGGMDAPPLDYMAGHLSAREIANMSGTIWNHAPAMISAFQAEGTPFPTFSDFEMADVVAYLHSKSPGRAAAPAGGGSEHGAVEMGTEPGNPARGRSVFATLGCGSCHTLAAAATTGTIGPNLDVSLKGKNASFVEQSLLDPNAVVAKGYERNTMPTFKATLTKQQLADLVAFLTQK